MAQEAPLKPPIGGSDDPEYAANLRRATLASTAGCALEYFDFALYGLALGVAVAREFSAVIAGGLAGVLGAYLIKVSGGSWVPLGAYTFVLAAITLATTFVTPETRQRDLALLNDALDDTLDDTATAKTAR